MIPVSIIIPSYNAESWISDTLQSAMAQSYPAIEIILVDDGSKDRTVSVAREKLQREFARSWKIIELEGNRGPSVARNLGLGVAGGDWIQFLDSDDLIAPDKLEREMAVCINCDPDVSAVYSPWRRYHAEAGEIIWEGPLAKPNMQGKPPIMCLVGGDRFLHGAGLSRRSTLNQIGGFNEALRFWECEEVNVRLAKVGRFEQVQSLAPLYMWRMHRESAYIGGEKARYQLAPVALSWISLLLEAAEHRPLSDLGLLPKDRMEILDSCTIWARRLFWSDRNAFYEFIDMAKVLDPNLVPTKPFYISRISRYLSYEKVEEIVRFGEMPKEAIRRLLQKFHLRPKDSIFE